MNSVKRHPSREMLAHFFLESDVFKGINISEAVNEFLDKFYPGYDDVIWVVVDDSPSKFEVVSAFSQYEDAEKLESLLPHSRIEGVGLDAPIKLLRVGSQLFDVKLDENGELVSVKKNYYISDR